MAQDLELISIIIPVRNAEATIGACLAAVLSLDDERYEVVVVDDASEDASVAIIRGYPCTLVRLETHSGAAVARNTGVRNSAGGILFFTDADCLVAKDALSRVRRALPGTSGDLVLGGTYTPLPYDRDFFSIFQSLFIHHSETKECEHPDYVATHAMAITAEAFRRIGGFSEKLTPILEDVEISHRLRRAGYRLRMDPDLQVQHVFRHSLMRSIGNAVRKAAFWTRYSLRNRDLLADSGAASRELKVNGLAWMMTVLAVLFSLFSGQVRLLSIAGAAEALNVWVNRRLFRTFLEAKGPFFAAVAASYYLFLYPAAVWAGFSLGLARHIFRRREEAL